MPVSIEEVSPVLGSLYISIFELMSHCSHQHLYLHFEQYNKASINVNIDGICDMSFEIDIDESSKKLSELARLSSISDNDYLVF